MFLPPEWPDYNDPFPTPVTPPPDPPGGGELVELEVNRAWLALVTGAATVLCVRDTWEEMSDEDWSTFQLDCYDLLDQLNRAAVDPPFYESDETADDDELPEAPWYETLSDWIIEGFLAVTFTPDAAIVYQQTIPRIRLAFRTGFSGALVRVLIDSLEIWAGSTNAADVGQVVANLDVEAFAAENNLGGPPWELRIEHAGTPPGMVQRRGEVSEYKLEVELGDIRPRVDMLQFQQTDCGLQVSVDGGTTWTDVYDGLVCLNSTDGQNAIKGYAQDVIDENIADGRLQKGVGQQGPTDPPAAAECRHYLVRLNGNDRWHCPSPVKDGDSIRVTNASGGWYDGFASPVGPWYCPEGTRFALGKCLGDQPYQETDPLQAGNHMQIVGNFDETWFDPLSNTYVVPAGQESVDFYLQANDGTLSDNLGSVDFDVEVCTNADAIGLSYQYEGENPSYMISGDEVTITFYAHPTFGAGYVGVIFDRPVDVVYVSHTGSWTGTPAGSGVYSWYEPDNTNWANPSGTTDHYVDVNNIERLAIWNTTAGAEVVFMVTVHTE